MTSTAPRSRHLALLVALVTALAVLVPGVASSASAGVDEYPAPTAVMGIGGYRMIDVSFTAPEPREGPTVQGYEYQAEDATGPLAVTPSEDGRSLSGVVYLGADRLFWTLSVRAVYGDGLYSAWRSTPYPVKAYGPPGRGTGAYLFPSSTSLSLRALPVTNRFESQSGWRMAAAPLGRPRQLRSVTCDDQPDGCALTGLRTGVRYAVTYWPVNVYEVAGLPFVMPGTATSQTVVTSRGPQAPRDLRVAPGDGEAFLSWTSDQATPGFPVEDFQVRYAGRWHPLQAVLIPAESTVRGHFAPRSYTATVPDLKNGRAHALRVRGLLPRIGPDAGQPGLASKRVVVRPAAQQPG